MTPNQIAAILASYNRARERENRFRTGSFDEIEFLMDEFSHAMKGKRGFNESAFRRKILGIE